MKKSKWSIYMSFKRGKTNVTFSFRVNIHPQKEIPDSNIVRVVNSLCRRFNLPPEDLQVCDKCGLRNQCPYYIYHKRVAKVTFIFSPAQMKLRTSKLIVKPIKTIKTYGKSQRTTHKVK